VPENQLPCPTGMFRLGGICFEAAESCLPAGANYLGALYICQAKGLRLCTFGEWYLACVNFSSQVQDMTNNPEWVDHVELGPDGGLVGITVGNGGCDVVEERSIWFAGGYCHCCL
jgi:hypothetical protein